MIRKIRLKQIYKAVQAVEGEMSSLPGVMRDIDRQEWLVRTFFNGLQSIKPGQWMVWLEEKLIIMDDIDFNKMFEVI